MATDYCTATVFVVSEDGTTEELRMLWSTGLLWGTLETRGFSLDAAVDLFHAASKCSH